MKYKVLISSNAKRQIDEKVKFLFLYESSNKMNYLAEVITAIKSLEDFPSRFPVLYSINSNKKKYRKMVVSDYVLIIFQIIGQEVRVEFVLDCKQDYSWLLKR